MKTAQLLTNWNPSVFESSSLFFERLQGDETAFSKFDGTTGGMASSTSPEEISLCWKIKISIYYVIEKKRICYNLSVLLLRLLSQGFDSAQN